MIDLIRRLVWFFIVASAVAYAIFLVAGNAIYTQALGQSRVVLVRDHLKAGEHHLSGMVMVPYTCEQLSVRTEGVDVHTIHLHFNTWKEPNVDCSREDTPRAFRAVVFAPAVGVSFTATLNGEPLQLAVTPSTSVSY